MARSTHIPKRASCWSGEIRPLTELEQTSPIWLDHRVQLGLSNIEFTPNGVIRRLQEGLGLKRLLDFRQLMTLTPPLWDASGRQRVSLDAIRVMPHTRWQHSLGAVALAEQLAVHCLTYEERKLLVVAALTHDAATPAGGDPMKRALGEFMGHDHDEDRGYANWLKEGQRISHLKDLLKTTKRRVEGELTGAIHGAGLLGSAMNVVDTGSYLDGDYHKLVNDPYIVSEPWWEPIESAVATLKHRAWFESIARRDGVIMVKDVESLEAFLRLRADLWRDYYTRPQCQFLETLLREIYVPGLLERKRLSSVQLLEHADAWLENLIEEEFAGSLFRLSAHTDEVWCSVHKTREELLADEAELTRQDRITLMCGPIPTVSSKVKVYYTEVHEGGRTFARSFARAYPKRAADIQAIIDRPEEKPHTLFSFPRSGKTRGIEKAWRKARLRWRNKK